MSRLNAWLDLIARFFISAIFIYEAYDSLKFYSATKEKMISYGITWGTDFFFNLSLVLLIIGGLFMLMGYRSKFAALLLFLYYFPLTFFIYSFWNYEIGSLDHRLTAVNFMKNIAVCGGLVMIMINGSGRYSIKRLLDRRRVNSKF